MSVWIQRALRRTLLIQMWMVAGTPNAALSRHPDPTKSEGRENSRREMLMIR